MRSKNLKDLSNFPLCLAPMVGLTHVALRLVVREFMPEQAHTIWPTEMLSSRRLKAENLDETNETKRGPDENDLVPQILGNEEESIRLAIEKLAQWGAVGVDINMGCPVQKALKHNYGVALMGDSDYAAEVVQMAVRNSLGLPISVKLRAGHQSNMDILISFAKKLEAAGASWLTLHPRTAEQKRRGQADWSQIGLLKKELRIPLIGNGDIQIADDVFQMLQSTGCDMVMAGRALAARPWMVWQVGERLGFAPPSGFVGRAPATSDEEGQMYGYCLLKQIHHCRNYFSEEQSLRKLRFYIRTTSVWLEFGHELIKLSTKLKTLDEVEKGIQDFFSRPQRMFPRTELRQ